MDAYSEGYNAFYTGVSFYTNPYASGEQDFRRWNDGWLSALSVGRSPTW